MYTFLGKVRGLLRDQAFILSAGLSVAATFLFMSLAVYLLSLDRINIIKIAEVSSLEVSHESEAKSKPISGIFQLANIDFSKLRADAEISTIKSQIWHGYLIKLEKFCKISHAYDQIVGVWVGSKFTPLSELGTIANVIVKTENIITAGLITIWPKTCEIAKKMNGNEQIYIVSDAPFANIESTPTYVSIVKIDR